jgi:DNA transformation protein
VKERPRIKFRSLRVRPEFRDFVLDQLSRVPQLRSRRMFGGVGIYSGEHFFALIASDELFFKVDDSTRAGYEAAGGKAFQPVQDRPVSMSYWSVPVEVLEDPAELALWARAAIRVAAEAPPKARRRKKRARKA